jgi:hypothetical protein
MTMFSSRVWRRATWVALLIVLSPACLLIVRGTKAGGACDVYCGGTTCFSDAAGAAWQADAPCNNWWDNTGGCKLTDCTATGNASVKIQSAIGLGGCPLLNTGPVKYWGTPACSNPIGAPQTFTGCYASCLVHGS